MGVGVSADVDVDVDMGESRLHASSRSCGATPSRVVGTFLPRTFTGAQNAAVETSDLRTLHEAEPSLDTLCEVDCCCREHLLHMFRHLLIFLGWYHWTNCAPRKTQQTDLRWKAQSVDPRIPRSFAALDVRSRPSHVSRRSGGGGFKSQQQPVGNL